MKRKDLQSGLSRKNSSICSPFLLPPPPPPPVLAILKYFQNFLFNWSTILLSFPKCFQILSQTKHWRSYSNLKVGIFFSDTLYIKQISRPNIVGSTDQAPLSSFKCGFLNIFSRQNMLRNLSRLLDLLRWNKYGAKKCLKNHIPFDFWDNSTLANQGAEKQ